jgi:hypothetical protein
MAQLHEINKSANKIPRCIAFELGAITFVSTPLCKVNRVHLDELQSVRDYSIILK